MADEQPRVQIRCGGTSDVKQPDENIQKIVDDVINQKEKKTSPKSKSNSHWFIIKF
jgi:hypothetical protein